MYILNLIGAELCYVGKSRSSCMPKRNAAVNWRSRDMEIIFIYHSDKYCVGFLKIFKLI